MQKKEVVVSTDLKRDMVVGGIYCGVPLIVIALIPWLWLRLLIAVVFLVASTVLVIHGWNDETMTLYSDECTNQKLFGDKPLDCKIRRDDDGTETIDDLDFPNSRK